MGRNGENAGNHFVVWYRGQEPKVSLICFYWQCPALTGSVIYDQTAATVGSNVRSSLHQFLTHMLTKKSRFSGQIILKVIFWSNLENVAPRETKR